MDVELRPCPFCLGDNLEFDGHEQGLWSFSYVECQDCGGDGPPASIKGSVGECRVVAAERWNSRNSRRRAMCSPSLESINVTLGSIVDAVEVLVGPSGRPDNVVDFCRSVREIGIEDHLRRICRELEAISSDFGTKNRQQG